MRLGIIGDFACPTGLGAVNHALASELAASGWEISVLAVNYHGDPHDFPYRLYPASADGHLLGMNRVRYFVETERPDVLLIHFDPWLVRRYLERLAELPITARPPVVAYVPVDGIGLSLRDGRALNDCAHVLAYTHVGGQELRAAGYDGELTIAPLGLDLDTWSPLDRTLARRACGFPDDDALIVLVADRNQSRKRLDLAFDAFARLAARIPTARLVYHGAPCEPSGYDVELLVHRYGLAGKVALTMPGATDPAPGLPDEVRRRIYCAADIKLSSAMGEGWGLTTAEAMACGVPCVAVDWAAIPEWAGSAVTLVPASATYTYVPSMHQGGAASPEDLAAALLQLATDPGRRAAQGALGRARMADPALRWGTIGQTFDHVLSEVAGAVHVSA